MFSLTKILRTLAIAAGFASATLATQAQAQAQSCGLTGISALASPLVYDPFNPSGFTNNNIVLNITRINPPGGGTTSVLNFYLDANAQTGSAASGIQLIPVAVSGQATLIGGFNIFYSQAETPPTLLPISLHPTAGNRFAKISFTGNNAGSDTVAVTFQVILPPNLQLNAVQSLAFDAHFACNIQGGQLNGQTQTGDRANAVIFPVTVLSALRTYYAGTDLSFGDITTVPPTPPAPVRTNPGNYIFIQSSGAYSVELASQNAFKMKKPGAVTANDEIRYSLKFLGETRDNSTTPAAGATAITKSCIRAGMATEGTQLPIQATLQEGGQNKNPSLDYKDILTVTITPLAYAVTGTDDCGSYSVP